MDDIKEYTNWIPESLYDGIFTFNINDTQAYNIVLISKDYNNFEESEGYLFFRESYPNYKREVIREYPLPLYVLFEIAFEHYTYLIDENSNNS